MYKRILSCEEQIVRNKMSGLSVRLLYGLVCDRASFLHRVALLRTKHWVCFRYREDVVQKVVISSCFSVVFFESETEQVK